MGWTKKSRRGGDVESTMTVSIRVGGIERGPLPTRPTRRTDAVEVIFVFDTTGSMYGKIKGLISCTEQIVSDLVRSGLSWSVTAVPFGDLTVPGDTIEQHLPWVSNVRDAKELLRSMPRNSGGGNRGESSHEAVLDALEKDGNETALRVLVLITDEPPLCHNFTTQHVQAAVVAADALMFVVSPPLESFKTLATTTGGEWFEISSHVDLSSIAEMLRSMGRKLALRATTVAQLGGSPQAALALESGGNQ